MKVRAPGKLLLTGGYAVLERAPALVLAVDRFAVADDGKTMEPSREVREALGQEPAPFVDASAMYAGGSKLGLGSSSAVLVASLGARAARLGDDLGAPSVRKRLFEAARDAHGRAQGGGSGVDIAASVFGGALRYELGGEAPRMTPQTFPRDLVFAVYFSGTSARTSELRARVDALRERSGAAYEKAFAPLVESCHAAAQAFGTGAVPVFLDAARWFAEALAGLGRAADAPIVPASFATLATLATREDAVFFPSGAGGGDVGVYLGARHPSEAFEKEALAVGMTPLAIALEPGGVQRLPPDA